MAPLRSLIAFAALAIATYILWPFTMIITEQQIAYNSKCVTAPFCATRATLLEALSDGGRDGYGEPYVGKGCTYRWFPPTEVCMIVERFNAIVFVGDGVAKDIYAAFNLLLQEDHQRVEIRNTRQDCQKPAVSTSITKSIRSKTADSTGKKLCNRIPHTYIPLSTTPAPTSALTVFKDLTYSHPRPWQPSPLIFSFNSNLDRALATKSLDEWKALATGAERNIPMLFLGPHATTAVPGSKEHEQEMAVVAKERNWDVLGLWNLSVQATQTTMLGGERVRDDIEERDMESERVETKFGEDMAMVEAMMIVNWLSKLETS